MIYNSIPIVECELPLIDLARLGNCKDEEKRMIDAASEWGFFQVVNHGISQELLRKMRRQQMKLFHLPFETKATSGILNGSYRWGAPTAAASLNNFSWSEAFHVPLATLADDDFDSDLREVMREVAKSMSAVAGTVAGVLARNLAGGSCSLTTESSCNNKTCFLRLNRYPPCPLSAETYGLVPHTDSDFLTVVYQDEVGGLQLMKDSKWVAVKPNTDALIVNIGDLFQAWSNDVYKSVEHKVMVNAKVERYSVAYFLCPSYDSTIGSCREPSPYRKFTFGEFRNKVQEDVKTTGQKVGLSRFLL